MGRDQFRGRPGAGERRCGRQPSLRGRVRLAMLPPDVYPRLVEAAGAPRGSIVVQIRPVMTGRI